jgi:O-antigen/teichoic acid export membrane protein
MLINGFPLSKYINNTFWMFFEYLMRVIAVIFVNIYIARYLGVESYGLLSYILTLISLFIIVSRLGLENILVRDLVRFPKKESKYMGTSFSLILLVSLILYLLLNIGIYKIETDMDVKLYISIISLGMLLQSFLVIDYYFQSQIKNKYSSIAKSIALLIGSIIKLYLISIDAGLYFLSIAYAVDGLLVAASLLIINYYKGISFLLDWDGSLIKPILKSSIPMIFVAIMGMLYMKIDQLMIKTMLDTYQLGLYSAAMKLYEGWVFIPYILSISILPVIIKIKEKSIQDYEKSLTILVALVFWAGIVISLIMIFLGEWLIIVTFGPDYIEAKNVLQVLFFSAAFNSLGVVSARYLIVEGMERKIIYRSALALFINVSLNLVLIPSYGIQGAAIATFIAIFMAYYVINMIDKDLVQLRKICNNGVFFIKLTKTNIK